MRIIIRKMFYKTFLHVTKRKAQSCTVFRTSKLPENWIIKQPKGNLMRAMKLLRLHPVTEFNLRKWIHHSKHDLSTGKSLQLSWASLAWPNWSFYRLRNKVVRDDPGAEYNSRGSKGAN
ncbi:hypothetical protein PAHAL_2G490800 [Panicum hallii]|uniref:Uncharacterized protein n=1 Tax=Panicum hallii TaxID=206008 RepID=A0A2S3H5F4_9POAL|nr:hypothetical protein PAHAL_2G490800 [Panicum hallii]